MVTVHLVNQVIGVTSSIERIRVPVWFVSSLPEEKVWKRAISSDLLSDRSQVLVIPKNEEIMRQRGDPSYAIYARSHVVNKVQSELHSFIEHLLEYRGVIIRRDRVNL